MVKRNNDLKMFVLESCLPKGRWRSPDEECIINSTARQLVTRLSTTLLHHDPIALSCKSFHRLFSLFSRKFFNSIIRACIYGSWLDRSWFMVMMPINGILFATSISLLPAAKNLLPNFARLHPHHQSLPYIRLSLSAPLLDPSSIDQGTMNWRVNTATHLL